MVVYTEYPASLELRPFVQCYTRFASATPTAAAGRAGGLGAEEALVPLDDPLVDRVIACAHTFLSFNFGDPLPLTPDGSQLMTGRAHVVGAVTRPGTMPVAGRVDLFGVTFRPGWASAFLRLPAAALTDQVLSLEQAWGRSGRALTEQLLEAPTVAARIRLVEQELWRRLAGLPASARTVPAIADHIVRHRGAITVEQLCAAFGFSRQHLARQFRASVGLSPKLFCRVVRFQNALDRVTSSPPSGWARAALELGYYDQAHLIAEFKEFTGFTPAAYAALR
jgi:AraC-like DNA-binding protein